MLENKNIKCAITFAKPHFMFCSNHKINSNFALKKCVSCGEDVYWCSLRKLKHNQGIQTFA